MGRRVRSRWHQARAAGAVAVPLALAVATSSACVLRELLKEQRSYHHFCVLRGAVATLEPSEQALVVVLLAGPLRHYIQELIDRIFYGRTYKYRRALLTFSKKMGNIINLDELASRMQTMLWTLLGVPAVNVPSLVGASGLPIGLQVVGRFGSDLATLRAAAWCGTRLHAAPR